MKGVIHRSKLEQSYLRRNIKKVTRFKIRGDFINSSIVYFSLNNILAKAKPTKKIHNKFAKPIDLDDLIKRHRRAIHNKDKFTLDIFISLWNKYPNNAKVALRESGITLDTLKNVTQPNQSKSHI